MRLTPEKILAIWRIRKQIINNPVNAHIISRYNEVSALFKKIIECDFHFDSESQTYILNGNPIVMKNGKKPSTDCYFACKEDEMTANRAFEGIYIMCNSFPNIFEDLIIKVGCLLGGFTMGGRHDMIDEYRIISNSSTGHSDNK